MRRLPASLSRAVVTDLLRDEMGFDGLAITDALDMRALAQGAAQVVDVIMAIRAGEDLLLGTADPDLIARMEEGLAQAELRGLTNPDSPAKQPSDVWPPCGHGWPDSISHRSTSWAEVPSTGRLRPSSPPDRSR